MGRPLQGLTFATAGDGTALAYGVRLLRLLGALVVPEADAPGGVVGALTDGRPPLASVPWRAAVGEPHHSWAASGAMALTGEEDGFPVSPGWALAAALAGAAGVLGLLSQLLGTPVDVDGPALLGERAANAGLHRRGRVSPGGACRLIRAADGWLAVSLPRPDDFAAVPAWLDAGGPGDGGTADDWWDFVAAFAGNGRAAALEERAGLLGLAVSHLGVPSDAAGDAQALARGQRWPVAPFLVHASPRGRQGASGRRNRAQPPGRPLVVDLSSLWAGPLCANLLGLAGARVVKVESISRPDGARLGPASFFQLLHAGHRSVALPLDREWGRAALRHLLAEADVVVEGSRPRAMEQLGIDPRHVVDAGAVWVSITAYGRTGPWRNRVGFGDDAAISAGLVAGPREAPILCADAAADPVAGIHAAVAAVACLLGGGGYLVDVSMREAVAAGLATRRLPELIATPSAGGWEADLGEVSVPVAPPRSRAVPGTVARLGADTSAVLAGLR